VRNQFSAFYIGPYPSFAVRFSTGLRRQNPVFTSQQITNCFTQRNSAVSVSALDASKAFDKVSHANREIRYCSVSYTSISEYWYENESLVSISFIKLQLH